MTNIGFSSSRLSLLVLGLAGCCLVLAGDTNKAYCPFFGNRAPVPQRKLSNCTWYQSYSCCRDIELKQIFPTVKTLPGSSPRCIEMLNYLMCYICSPEQYKFYNKEQKLKLSVCLTFCDDFFRECKSASLLSRKISETYDNGKLFCEKRGFNVVDTRNHENCFYWGPEHPDFTKSVIQAAFYKDQNPMHQINRGHSTLSTWQSHMQGNLFFLVFMMYQRIISL